ncbi:helix-turn-helix domain-containing protein [Methylococcus mesophilus]|uniref:helix-turn-helix domain-containing protein n=1 Tax=Methylococcus mesophilus TaxID=2993564 RepID=UPI00224B3631|nr:helix-turn-helix domain-containing protein [Methylococcus mesophilus]UZR29034.1 helix-turn-helix domain-containing protein [Methylococcus mesophilus]
MAILWSFDETARQLGNVSIRTVRRMIDRGELPTVRIGRRRMIPAEYVHAYVAEQIDLAHNFSRAGNVRQEKRTWLNEARGSTGAPIHKRGGQATPTAAAIELAAVLGLQTGKKPKHS